MTAWIEALRAECKRTSQARAAARLRQADGYPSPAVVNQVIKGRYRGRTDRLQALVEGHLMGALVECPGLGMEISSALCASYQAQPFAATNDARVRVWRACRSGCPHSRIKED